jgi:DNA end-binding protein Ku
MATRSLWKGAITFSLVHVPVALHSAVRASTLDLDLLDKRDFAPVGYQKINKVTGRPVEGADIVKGYEYQPGEYVVLTDEDFRQANVEATRTIEIQSFVDEGSVPPYYFDTPYRVTPLPGGEKVYALLPAIEDESLERAHRAKIGQKELGLALRLVEGMTDEWKPDQYRDTYRQDILARVEQKVERGLTHELTEPEGKEPEPKAPPALADLSALLERSLAVAGQLQTREPAKRSARGGSRRAKPERRG